LLAAPIARTRAAAAALGGDNVGIPIKRPRLEPHAWDYGAFRAAFLPSYLTMTAEFMDELIGGGGGGGGSGDA
jgi:hypothetical protein